ncbi:hypothetical protein ACU635_04125 [[Actinomadura] parvosata]|uniref:hypothetical protein n=1 Tax=[Actinomadura] parvosata TaxID=1955412 RepID=UPI00406CBA6B
MIDRQPAAAGPAGGKRALSGILDGRQVELKGIFSEITTPPVSGTALKLTP